MKITDFDLYKDLLARHSGLILIPEKSYLLESRLSPVAKKWGYSSLSDMTMALHSVPDKDLVADVIEAMTIGRTSFFRDYYSYVYFRDFALPFLVEHTAGRPLKIWSSGCSTGQEPYMLAMLIRSDAPSKNMQAEILATDLAAEALDHAREGLYSQMEVQRGLSVRMLLSYFSQEDEQWRINNHIRNFVHFRQFNLLDDMVAFGPFDVIFCRNVLTHLDPAICSKVLDRMSARMAPDGFFFTGSTDKNLKMPAALAPLPGKKGVFARTDSIHFQK